MSNDASLRYTKVEFHRFKAFKSFKIDLKTFNILVGPNNAGKSTIIAAFRILSAAMRRAGSRKATLVKGPHGNVFGYEIDLKSISVAEENIFYNYDDEYAASVEFTLSNDNKLSLYFPERGICYLLPDAQGKSFQSPSGFKKQFDCPIGFVPILGPVEHNELLYGRDAARLALFSYTAARNFRNIWHHYPERFEEFQNALRSTWPGMDISRPEIDRSHDAPRLYMYCPENRIPREIFWAGFGFQVWCQMLTHLIQSKEFSIFLIDEPDIYLHSELQRQLLGLLRTLGPDIIIATHSTEMMTEAETSDIVVINKNKPISRRLKNSSQLESVFNFLGSSLNPVLTQLAKTRRVLFVEGKDYKIIGKFAQKIGSSNVSNRRDFAVIPIGGFNLDRIRNLKAGMEATLGGSIVAAAVLDSDYRCEDECESIRLSCSDICQDIIIHKRKEIENFLIVSSAINQAANKRIQDKARRNNTEPSLTVDVYEKIVEICDSKKSLVASQMANEREVFERSLSSNKHRATITQIAFTELEEAWKSVQSRFDKSPGKEVISEINEYLQKNFEVNVTPTLIIDAMRPEEVPVEMMHLIRVLEQFSAKSP